MAVALVLAAPDVCSAQCQLQKIYPIGPDPCEQFGKGLDMDGDRLVVGGHSADDDPQLPCATGGTGVAYVFDRVGSGWIQTQRLLASDGGPNDEFGNSVAVSGDCIVVGSEYHDGAGSNSGAAYVFELEGSTWVEVAKLEAPDAHASHYFARSVSIAGDLIVCGTRFDQGQGYQSGAAYIFQRDDLGQWNWIQKIRATDGAEDDLFGNSVATDGSTIVCGAYWKNGESGVHAGAAYVFEKHGGPWFQSAKLLASDQAEGAEFGRYVAVDGDRILVGAVRDLESGSAYVFERQASLWVESAKLIPGDGASNDKFGESCDIQGDNLIVGSRNGDSPLNSGTVYLYQYQNDAWIEAARLKPMDVVPGNSFGYNCALSGDIVVGGSPYDYVQYGTASIFSISGACAGLPYGTEYNPPGSLIQMSAAPSPGSVVTLGINNPYGTQAPGSIPLLVLAGAPQDNFPGGKIINFGGMSGPGATCELLTEASTILVVGAPWQGPGIPAPVSIAIPNNPIVVGKTFYTQGWLFDPFALGGVSTGCTTAMQVTIAP